MNKNSIAYIQRHNIKKDADRIKGVIRSEIRQGIIPKSVKSWTDLHDHVDANMYLVGCQQFGFSQNNLDYMNAVTDVVDKWLRGGRK